MRRGQPDRPVKPVTRSMSFSLPQIKGPGLFTSHLTSTTRMHSDAVLGCRCSGNNLKTRLKHVTRPSYSAGLQLIFCMDSMPQSFETFTSSASCAVLQCWPLPQHMSNDTACYPSRFVGSLHKLDPTRSIRTIGNETEANPCVNKTAERVKMQPPGSLVRECFGTHPRRKQVLNRCCIDADHARAKTDNH
jgi:hypothetical protein